MPILHKKKTYEGIYFFQYSNSSKVLCHFIIFSGKDNKLYQENPSLSQSAGHVHL